MRGHRHANESRNGRRSGTEVSQILNVWKGNLIEKFLLNVNYNDSTYGDVYMLGCF